MTSPYSSSSPSAPVSSKLAIPVGAKAISRSNSPSPSARPSSVLITLTRTRATTPPDTVPPYFPPTSRQTQTTVRAQNPNKASANCCRYSKVLLLVVFDEGSNRRERNEEFCGCWVCLEFWPKEFEWVWWCERSIDQTDESPSDSTLHCPLHSPTSCSGRIPILSH